MLRLIKACIFWNGGHSEVIVYIGQVPYIRNTCVVLRAKLVNLSNSKKCLH